MVVQQLRHLPLSTAQDTIGMLSYQAIAWPHAGHDDGGKTIFSSLTSLYATTFKNDPQQAKKGIKKQSKVAKDYSCLILSKMASIRCCFSNWSSNLNTSSGT